MTLDPQGRWHYTALLIRDGDANVAEVGIPNSTSFRLVLKEAGPEITDGSVQRQVQHALSLAFHTESTDQFTIRVDRSQYPIGVTA